MSTLYVAAYRHPYHYIYINIPVEFIRLIHDQLGAICPHSADIPPTSTITTEVSGRQVLPWK